MHKGDSWRLGYRPELDGVRGVAIVLVVAGHTQLLPFAGPIGVTVFFALSGFLITSLLIEERDRTGRVSLSAFYARRARRLFPALGAYLGVSIALTLAGVGVYAFSLVEYLGPVFYFENWLIAFREGAPPVTAITWSLAIEEQFYLVWPLVVIACGRWGSRRLLIGVCAVGTLLAPALRVLFWDGGHGQWRLYYGTDTRMDCLLSGCLLAVLVHRVGVPSKRWGWWWPAGAVLIVAPIWGGITTHVWLPTVVAAGSVVVIVSALTGGARWLAWPMLRWLGRRSYALYLWHYPLVYVFAAQLDVLPLWVALVWSLALAEASWWLIERPFIRRRSPVAVEDRSPLQGDFLREATQGAGASNRVVASA